MRKKLPFIPVQPADKMAEFAGFLPPEYNFNHKRSNKFSIFRDSIIKLLFSNFRWEGLTEREQKTIEYNLIFRGRVCAIRSRFDVETKTPDGIFYGAYGSETNNVTYDFYGFPNQATCTGLNGQIFTANSPDDFEVGFDSSDNIYQFGMLTTPLYSYVDILADELDRSYCAWQVAAETRKLGMVFQCQNQKSANILKDVLKRISENDPYVIINSDISDQTDVLWNSSNTQGISEYHMHFMNTWGFVLDLLGMENNSQNKKERLVVTEAEMNRSLSRYLGANRLMARKLFAKNCNEKFGTNIKVENYLDSIVNENPNEANIYGMEDGEENVSESNNNAE